MFGITCIIWKISAEKEEFAHKPEPGRFYPSRQYVSVGTRGLFIATEERGTNSLLSQLEPAIEGLGRGGQEGGRGEGGAG